MEACFPWLGETTLKPVMRILQKHGVDNLAIESENLVSYGATYPLLVGAWSKQKFQVRYTLLKLLFTRIDRHLWRKFGFWKQQGYPIFFPRPLRHLDLIALLRETSLWDRPTRLLLFVILGMHADGFVREIALGRLLNHDTPPALAVLLQGIGGYVTKISIPLAEQCLQRADWATWHRFARENPTLFNRERDRMISFWNLKRRREYPKLRDYPPYQFFRAIRMHQEH